MLRKSWLVAAVSTFLLAGTALAGTFGKVVSIGGEASDLALDEARGLLYIANFTANRIDVMSLANNTIVTSINVAAQPSSMSLSPNGRWLLTTHFGNNAAPASPSNSMTLIDLTNGAIQTFALGNPPLGTAFGIDNKALVVTTVNYLLFDPGTGQSTLLDTIAGVTSNSIPVPQHPLPCPGTASRSTEWAAPAAP
jgi:DNA-binding beta-propeller fold protein YncE